MSTIFPSAVEHHAQSVNASKLRDLDAFEEFFWLVEQSVNISHAVVVEVSGSTTIEQWKDALDAIQIRYPLLSASIVKAPGERPFFEKTRGVSMPSRIAPLWDSLVLEEEMENELQKSFGDGSGPLTRATLFHGRDRSVVMFATHVEMLKVRLHRLQLSVEETEVLLERAREERTTVRAALVAALTLAGKRYSEEWNVWPVCCMPPN